MTQPFKFAKKPVLISLAALILCVMVVAGTLRWLYPVPRNPPFPQGASPREQVEFEQGQLLDRYYQEQMHQLNTYGWVNDREAHVPIARAIDLLLEKTQP